MSAPNAPDCQSVRIRQVGYEDWRMVGLAIDHADGYESDDDDDSDASKHDTSLLRQLDTTPITPSELVSDVKVIYEGITMIEKKAFEIHQAQLKAGKKLSNDQWQALFALHRTLLYEYHDYFYASQHPAAPPTLQQLTEKYIIRERMWTNGIYSLLELLRKQLPSSLEHMLAFVHLAYSLITELLESVPEFQGTWLEWLGHISRYRLESEKTDLHLRQIWTDIGRDWYMKAAHFSPNAGKFQHHFAVLARPNIVRQFFYYSKALVSVEPFALARDDIMLVLDPLKDEAYYSKYPAVEASFVSALGILINHGTSGDYQVHIDKFLSGLDVHIRQLSAHWRAQGPEIATALLAAVLDFGYGSQWGKDTPDGEWNPLWKLYHQYYKAVGEEGHPTKKDQKSKADIFHAFWSGGMPATSLPKAMDISYTSPKLGSSEEITFLALKALRSAIEINTKRIGDRNIVPFMCIVLTFLWSMAFVGPPILYVEAHIPWSSIILFLNTLPHSAMSDARMKSDAFPAIDSSSEPQLRLDFNARGAVWWNFYPSDFFNSGSTDQHNPSREPSGHERLRDERCLWLGARLASLGRWILYDKSSKRFSISAHVVNRHQSHPLTSTPTDQGNHQDEAMTDG